MSASPPSAVEAGRLASDAPPEPWQLRLFSKSLKKRQKVALLAEQIRELPGRKRLLVTCGDNNGAMNHELRKSGGDWTWMEMEKESIRAMSELLGDPVLPATAARLDAEDASFDVVISLDVQEHLAADDLLSFHSELFRVTRPGGHVVATTPNGDAWKPVSVLRRMLGMKKEKYGHVVYGYNVGQQQKMLRASGFEPTASGSYSGFFTELIELGLNFVYTTLLSGRRTGRRDGEIAPSSAEKLEKVRKQYRAYALVYPLFYAISRLDVLLPLGAGYAVSVVARRPATSGEGKSGDHGRR